jgi:hypothetical protein
MEGSAPFCCIERLLSAFLFLTVCHLRKCLSLKLDDVSFTLKMMI